jgi:hypothetical protein
MIFRGSENRHVAAKNIGTSAECTAPELVSGDAGHVARRPQRRGLQIWTRAATMNVAVLPAHRSESGTGAERAQPLANANSVAVRRFCYMRRA